MEKKFVCILKPEEKERFYREHMKPKGYNESWLNDNLAYVVYDNYYGNPGRFVVVSKRIKNGKDGVIYTEKI